MENNERKLKTYSTDNSQEFNVFIENKRASNSDSQRHADYVAAIQSIVTTPSEQRDELVKEFIVITGGERPLFEAKYDIGFSNLGNRKNICGHGIVVPERIKNNRNLQASNIENLWKEFQSKFGVFRNDLWDGLQEEVDIIRSVADSRYFSRGGLTFANHSTRGPSPCTELYTGENYLGTTIPIKIELHDSIQNIRRQQQSVISFREQIQMLTEKYENILGLPDSHIRILDEVKGNENKAILSQNRGSSSAFSSSFGQGYFQAVLGAD